MGIAVVAEILEQILAGEVLAFGDDALQIGVGDGDFVDDAMLAGELHPQLAALLDEVAVAQGGGAEALVRARILFVADADMLGIEQADDRGEDGVAAEFALLEVGFDPLAQFGESGAEVDHRVEFRLVAAGAEIVMIAILLAAAGVDPGGLQMAVGIGAVPGVGIGRGKGDLIEPVNLLAVGDALAVGGVIGPAELLLVAGYAGGAGVGMAQMLHSREGFAA